MYICLCNRLTDRDLRAQCGRESCSVSMVYRALGAEPQCGKCVPFVRQMLRQAVESALPCPAAAAAG
ncbi:MAG: (2Fe-2S)-binding protein [Alphaproteobacteria bacterium]|nr:(2Fe-2S)-binding protein [Alphaproteobacteria bacterium]MBV9861429.1 (2Fe-2S)-binding protein [Alphaproteobacteria bacterium]